MNRTIVESLGPSSLWLRSTILHKTGHRRRARLLKAVIFIVYRAVLPPEADLAGRVSLGHYGLGVVVHPRVKLGINVHLWHGATLSVSDAIESDTLLEIGDNVEIGAHAVLITPLKMSMTIASNTRIGANAVVTKSISTGGTYVGIPARRIGNGVEQSR